MATAQDPPANPPPAPPRATARKVLGKWPGLGRDELNEGRDLALTTDFRTVFGEIALKHLGASGLSPIFPGFAGTPADFRGVLRSA